MDKVKVKVVKVVKVKVKVKHKVKVKVKVAPPLCPPSRSRWGSTRGTPGREMKST